MINNKHNFEKLSNTNETKVLALDKSIVNKMHPVNHIKTDNTLQGMNLPTGYLGRWDTKVNYKINNFSDLNQLYSPGIASLSQEIYLDPSKVYHNTGISNLVAVISNGTAVLGLGNLGALASKPVMEGKAALFKQFAGINAIDLEVSATDIDKFVEIVTAIGYSFGGINLEDISAPECFEIEKYLQKNLSLPIFHDDQHGTAIAILAGLINALKLTNRSKEQTKFVVIGAGAAGITIAKLLKDWGIPKNNLLVCDSKGIINKKRTDLNKYKKELASEIELNTLTDALKGADVVIGLSKGDILTPEMLQNLSLNPILFLLSNPRPEIDYKILHQLYPNAIIALGGYNRDNQINNLLVFPYIFRGMLDAKVLVLTLKIKLAVAETIAKLADIENGKIVPSVLDSRLLSSIASVVVKVAMEEGLSHRQVDLNSYNEYLNMLIT